MARVGARTSVAVCTLLILAGAAHLASQVSSPAKLGAEATAEPTPPKPQPTRTYHYRTALRLPPALEAIERYLPPGTGQFPDEKIADVLTGELHTLSVASKAACDGDWRQRTFLTSDFKGGHLSPKRRRSNRRRSKFAFGTWPDLVLDRGLSEGARSVGRRFRDARHRRVPHHAPGAAIRGRMLRTAVRIRPVGTAGRRSVEAHRPVADALGTERTPVGITPVRRPSAPFKADRHCRSSARRQRPHSGGYGHSTRS
jgi:hypothetical protein